MKDLFGDDVKESNCTSEFNEEDYMDVQEFHFEKYYDEFENHVKNGIIKLEAGNPEHARFVKYLEKKKKYQEYIEKVGEKTYEVTVSFRGHTTIEVKAINEKQAERKANDQFDTWDIENSDYTIEIDDIEEIH